MTDIAKDEARWQRLKAQARALAAKAGPRALDACETALALGEVVRWIARTAVDDQARRAWLRSQAKKAAASDRARKVKAREERKRLRREACDEVANARPLWSYRNVAANDALALCVARKRQARGEVSEAYVAAARRKARDSAIVYAAHCAAAGAVPSVEA